MGAALRLDGGSCAAVDPGFGLLGALAPEAVLIIALGAAVDVHLVGALFQDEGGDAEDDDAREEQDADAQAGAEKEVEELIHCAVLLSCWNTWRNTLTSIYLHCTNMHRIAASPR